MQDLTVDFPDQLAGTYYESKFGNYAPHPVSVSYCVNKKGDGNVQGVNPNKYYFK